MTYDSRPKQGNPVIVTVAGGLARVWRAGGGVAGLSRKLGLAAAVVAVGGFGIALAGAAPNVNPVPHEARAARAVALPDVDRYNLVIERARVRLEKLDLEAVGSPAGMIVARDDLAP